ncbi:hypothetical protein PUN28_017769 [Cardiocondyla obscurior]|uniref:Uncharacterized protein n=1 Tax=Cardiocondyla obscurior TaxID=286306 RepID=A0AAW2EKN5_9HYME
MDIFRLGKLTVDPGSRSLEGGEVRFTPRAGRTSLSRFRQEDSSAVQARFGSDVRCEANGTRTVRDFPEFGFLSRTRRHPGVSLFAAPAADGRLVRSSPGTMLIPGASLQFFCIFFIQSINHIFFPKKICKVFLKTQTFFGPSSRIV